MSSELVRLMGGSPQVEPRDSQPLALSVNAQFCNGWEGLAIDLETMGSCGVHPTLVPTALAAAQSVIRDRWQDGGASAFALSASVVSDMALAARIDLQPTATKLGFLGCLDTLHSVADQLVGSYEGSVVLDPEIEQHAELAMAARVYLRDYAERFAPSADLLVVHHLEAAALSGRDVDGPGSMKEAAKRLFDFGPRFVLITGGHLDHIVRDYFYDGSGFVELGADKIAPGVESGPGTVLSASITAGLARGLSVLDAVARSRDVVNRSIEGARLVAGRLVVDPWSGARS